MLTLDTTTVSLELLLAESGAIPASAAYQQVTTDGSVIPTFGSTRLPSNGTTPITLMAAPASGKIRRVDGINVHNDAGAVKTVTIRYNDNTTMRKIITVALSDGDTLTFDGRTFSVIGADGKTKVSSSGGGAGVGFAASVGDGSATSYVVTHSLGTRDVVVSIVETASPYNAIIADWAATTTDTITVTFFEPPTSNQYRVSIVPV